MSRCAIRFAMNDELLPSFPAAVRLARGLDIDLLENLIAAADRMAGGEHETMAGDAAKFFRMLRPARRPQMAISSCARVDVRRTLRDLIGCGGQIERIHFHERVREKRLAVLLDVSESALGPGMAMLARAFQQVSPRIIVLGFDTEVFALRGASVEAIARQSEQRCARARSEGRPFLSLGDFEQILRQARRFLPGAVQSYLLIVSDLIVPEGTMLSPTAVSRVRGELRRFRRCWLVDGRPTGEPFVEDEEGLLTCSAQGLLDLIERGGEPAAQLAWWVAEHHGRESRIPLSALRLRAQIGQSVVLAAHRFTPWVRQLGFALREPSPGNPLTFVSKNRPADFAAIFREIPTR